MDEINKYRRKKQQQFIHRRDVAEMNISNTPSSVVDTVKAILEKKKMTKADIAALADPKDKIDADDLAALRANKHKK